MVMVRKDSLKPVLHTDKRRDVYKRQEQDAPALVFDLGHGGNQLLSAVTAERAKGVSGQALGMDPAENVLSVADVALYQRDMVLSVQTAHKAVGFEIAVFRGHIHRLSLIHI